MRALINVINSGTSRLDRWTDKHPGRALIVAGVMVVLILGALYLHAAAIGRVVPASLVGVQL